MKNKKGFSLIELMIVIAIFFTMASLILSVVFNFMEKEKIAQKTGSLIKEFKDEVNPEIKVITKTKIIDKSGVQCLEGKKVITIDGVTYYLGTVKNTWGDLTPVECEE